jgi:deazaflavin-dependent oxidoreductase (nitroreductase family)
MRARIPSWQSARAGRIASAGIATDAAKRQEDENHAVRRRSAVEDILALGGKLIIVGGSWGAQSHPAWVRNLWANPSVHVEVGTESFDATARELPVAERELVWTQVVATAPVIGEYQSRTGRVIPLFELQRHQG